MFCPHCGTEVPREGRFCPACGTRLAPPEQPLPTVRQYLGYLAILCLPGVNLAVMLLWAYGRRSGEPRRRFARAALWLLAVILAAAAAALAVLLCGIVSGRVPTRGFL